MARDFDPYSLAAQPPSPTLTNPDMILPFSSFSDSPPRKEQQPSLLLANVRDLDLTSYSLGSGKKSRNSSVVRTPPPTNHRQSSTLSDILEIETPRTVNSVGDTVASSPTLREFGAASQLSDWRSRSSNTDHRLSDTSSLHSEDLENLKWPGFDSHGGVDEESEMSEQEEERFGSFPKIAGSDDNVHEKVNDENDDNNWLGSRPDDDEDEDDDPLSRRADLILANAKKRLNVREDETLRAVTNPLTG
jgi:hypothetical protein